MNIRPRAGIACVRLAAALLCLTAVSALHAQSAGNSLADEQADPNLITVMRVNRLAANDARAVVVRRAAGQTPANVILVTAATTPSDLAKAVATLMSSRKNRGNVVQHELRASVSASGRGRGSVADERRARQDLVRLGGAPTVSIPGVGSGPAISIRTRPVAPKGGASAAQRSGVRLR